MTEIINTFLLVRRKQEAHSFSYITHGFSNFYCTKILVKKNNREAYGLHCLLELPTVNTCIIPSHSLNKRPMGHIAHLRKQFKSINTYDYIITLIERRKKTIINFMRINDSSFEQI